MLYVVLLCVWCGCVFVIDDVSGQLVEEASVGELNRLPVDEENQRTAHMTDPRYVVLASGVLRPGTMYRVVVVLLESADDRVEQSERYPLQVRASIAGAGTEIAAAKLIMNRGDQDTLLLQIPSNIGAADYRLRVEGDSRGSYGTGGSMFSNQTMLKFSPQFLTVLIQTSRPLYNFGQKIRFRIVMLKTDLRPFDDEITVYVLDSDGYVMHRWASVSSSNGIVSLKMQLPFIGKGGEWKIRAVVRGQVAEKSIQLTKYFVPQWEVFVLTPTYILLSDEWISGDVSASFTNDRPVTGTAVVELWIRPRTRHTEDDLKFSLVTAYTIPQFSGSESFSIPMSSLRGALNDLSNSEIKVLARVKDYWYNETYTGWCNSRLINSSVVVKFLGTSPQFFKPGMPFHGQVMVTYHDQTPLSPEILQKSSLKIRSTGGSSIVIPTTDQMNNIYGYYGNRSLSEDPEFRLEDPANSGPLYSADSANAYRINFDRQIERFLDEQKWEEFRRSGLHRFTFATMGRQSSMEVTAEFRSEDSGISASTTLRLEPTYSVSRKFLSVYTSTETFAVGQYGVFHVKTNFPMTHFYVTMSSKNLVVHADRIPVRNFGSSVLRTFSVAISSEMPPSVRLTAFHVTDEGEMLADSVQVAVGGINRGKTEILLNQRKDPSKNTVELGMRSDAGATFGTGSTRDYLYSLQAGHDINRASVLAALHSFEVSERPIHRALWRSRDGRSADQVRYFTTPSYGSDTNATFQLAELVVLTDAHMTSTPNSECAAGLKRCLTRGCYNVSQLCDGVNDCADRSDETQCDSIDAEEKEERKFKLYRRSWFKDLFDLGDGDWAWQLQYIGYIGTELKTLSVPKTNENWYINGFSISQNEGFGLVEQPLTYESNRPFYMTLEVVEQVRRGETVVARTLVVNNQPKEVLALLILKHSDDYRFIHVEADGFVSHQNPRTSSGDHHHLIPVGAGQSIEVAFPVKPLVQLGSIDVVVECITQYSRDVESATVNIILEGVAIGKHTSLLLDMESRAVENKFLKVFTDDTPEIQLKIERKYVYGSPQATVTVSGDVVGPIFSDKPMTTVSVFGRWLKSIDGSVFNFGYNVWSLHYMRLANQLTAKILRRTLKAISPFFVLIMKRFRKGAFLFYDGGYPSVWTTAWTVLQLQYSQFQDWDNHLYVEPKIISEAAKWLIQYQNDDGSFNETEWYHAPLDQKMNPRSPGRENAYRLQRIPLTAHVLITLQEIITKVEGTDRGSVSLAKTLASKYLERSLSKITDPYELAITSYALSVSRSSEREAAFRRLEQMAYTNTSGMTYWAREPIATNTLEVGVNQRPYIQPKNEQIWDAQAVEATSYALMVYVQRDSIGNDQTKIVTWLNTMRMFDKAWISTVDSLLALQALAQYSYRAQIRQITNMDVSVEFTSTRKRQVASILGNNTIFSKQFPLDKVWGHVNVLGRGSGQAVVQLDLSFGIDKEHLKDTAPRKAFDLKVREMPLDRIRNISIISVEAFVSWMNIDEAATSGAAVLEVEFPSGYRIDQQVVNALVVRYKRSSMPNLMSGKTAPDRIFWFFDRVYSNYTQHFNWTIYRRYLVANYTAFRSARVYEYFAPERFEMQIIDSKSLNYLDVCQVCGSYQCPYCPWYSGAISSSISILLLLFATFSALLLGGGDRLEKISSIFLT